MVTDRIELNRDVIIGSGLGLVGAIEGVAKAVKQVVRHELEHPGAMVNMIGRILGQELVNPNAGSIERVTIGYAAGRASGVIPDKYCPVQLLHDIFK